MYRHKSFYLTIQFFSMSKRVKKVENKAVYVKKHGFVAL